MVAAAGADVPAVDHELLGRQARLPRGVVEEFGLVDQLVEALRRMDVHLDHAGIGRDLQQLEPGIARRRVAFEHELHVECVRGQLDRREQFEIVLERGKRRHEQIQDAVAHLRAQCGARDPRGRFEALGAALCVVLPMLPAPAVGRPAAFDAAVAAPLHHRVRRRFALHAGQVARCVGGARMTRAERGRVGQHVARRERIALDEIRIVGIGDPRQRIERQPIAHRRIARHEVHPLVAEEPRAGLPARTVECRPFVDALDRQHVTDHAVELPVEHLAQSRAFELVVEPRVERIDVDGQPALAPQVVPHVLVAGYDEFVGQTEARGECVDEALRVVGRACGRFALVGEQRRVVPHRLAVGAPVDRQRPARQLLARIPLALPEMQEAAVAVFGAQPLHQLGRVAALGRAERIGVPFGAIAIVDRHEGRLAALRQPDVACRQRAVDLRAERAHGVPLRVGIRLGHARRFVHARHHHLVLERDFAFVDQPLDRRRARRLRRAGERNMPFAGEQP